jgi:hypothetical protein
MGVVLKDHITKAITTTRMRIRVIDGQEITLNEFGKQIIPGGQRRVILMDAVLPLE